jgi:quercetin 2,3-dioxygenase
MSDKQPSPIESIPARATELGSLKILRALPRRQRRMVGPWCFLDRYGPLSFGPEKPMDVAPHPHIGLQTVSWLVEGEIVHHDSLGCESMMHAGQLNLMTAGHGIAHSEETPKSNSGQLSGVQLWVALPGDQRDIPPFFNHYASLPIIEFGASSATLFIGELAGTRSPATAFSPIIGAEFVLREGGNAVLPLNPDFEHALFVLSGEVALDSHPLAPEALHYVGVGRDELSVSGKDARVLMIGGAPFGEPIVMWWNFVAGTHQEIAEAREDWMEHRRFGEVKAYPGPRLDAPDLAARFAPANPVS